MKSITQGALANKSGKVLESLVEGMVSQYGFRTVQFRDLHKFPGEKELLIQNAPYTTLYGSKGKTEFLLKSERFNLNVRIECKWQQSAGSVDEKLPHLYLSTVQAMPEKHVIILIDGDGFRDGAIKWLRNAVDSRLYIPENQADKKIEMMTSVQFITWVNKVFR